MNRNVLVVNGASQIGLAVAGKLAATGIVPTGICFDHDKFNEYVDWYRDPVINGNLLYTGKANEFKSLVPLILHRPGMVEGIITTGDDVFPACAYNHLHEVLLTGSKLVVVTSGDKINIDRILSSPKFNEMRYELLQMMPPPPPPTTYSVEDFADMLALPFVGI